LPHGQKRTGNRIGHLVAPSGSPPTISSASRASTHTPVFMSASPSSEVRPDRRIAVLSAARSFNEFRRSGLHDVAHRRIRMLMSQVDHGYLRAVARHVARRCVAALVLCAAAVAPANGQAAESPTRSAFTAESDRSRLAVVIVVDQLRADLVDRFAAHYGDDGFNRFRGRGAVFTHCQYAFAATQTGPGHATVGTGTLPRRHGIASNNDDVAECSSDRDYAVIGLPAGAKTDNGGSPLRLQCGTTADAIRAASPKAVVASISLKRRSAMLMVGKTADIALYWEDGRFVTSSFYAGALPASIVRMNEERFADRYFDTKWNRAAPEAAYAVLCGPDDDPNEGDVDGLGRTFPHPLKAGDAPGDKFHDALATSPIGNDLIVEAVTRLFDDMPLGRDDACDLLCISFSSNDLVGHIFGPDSHEVMDITIRTDQQLEKLFRLFDAKVGRDRYTVALTADHGVAPLATRAIESGVEAGHLSDKRIARKLNEAVAAAVGDLVPPEGIVSKVSLPWIYFNDDVMKRASSRRDEILAAARKSLTSIRGIRDVYSADQLAAPLTDVTDENFALAWNGYHPILGGDVYVLLDRNWYGGSNPATHGTPYDYDRRVPLMFYGAGVRRGLFDAAGPEDLAPTLLTMLGLKPLNTMTGTVRNQAVGRLFSPVLNP
jgi:predicted AlkP superfamily pyrophosphatase or phosphodiesterase